MLEKTRNETGRNMKVMYSYNYHIKMVLLPFGTTVQ
jgi:hypothetical protein